MALGGGLGHQSIAVARQGITLRRLQKEVATERLSLADIGKGARWRQRFFEPVVFGDRPAVSAKRLVCSESPRPMGAIWGLVESEHGGLEAKGISANEREIQWAGEHDKYRRIHRRCPSSTCLLPTARLQR
jgi:hypothetical protein